MTSSRRARLLAGLTAGALLVTACGGGDGSADTATSPATQGEDAASAPATGDPVATEQTTGEQGVAAAGGGDGVIVEDLCAGDQLLRGAITLQDLVDIGILTSTDAVVESNDAREASTYETFGFICNIVETVDAGEIVLTIGVSQGSSYRDIALEQADAAPETIGAWEVILTGSWLGPLTMRTTDAAGNRDSLFVMWVPADGSIPDVATLERLMRPLAEAIATRSSAAFPSS
jgi:hypothetical protein